MLDEKKNGFAGGNRREIYGGRCIKREISGQKGRTGAGEVVSFRRLPSEKRILAKEDSTRTRNKALPPF